MVWKVLMEGVGRPMKRGEECEMQIDKEQAQQDAEDVKLGWEGKLRLKRE